jgi:hypothetical protein
MVSMSAGGVGQGRDKFGTKFCEVQLNCGNDWVYKAMKEKPDRGQLRI